MYGLGEKVQIKTGAARAVSSVRIKTKTPAGGSVDLMVVALAYNVPPVPGTDPLAAKRVGSVLLTV